MSLAPGEQQALAAIETELTESDPEFTATLSRLAAQLPRRRRSGRALSWLSPSWPSLAWRERAVRITMLAIIASLFVACSIAGAIAASQAGHAAPRHAHTAVGTTVSPSRSMPFLG